MEWTTLDRYQHYSGHSSIFSDEFLLEEFIYSGLEGPELDGLHELIQQIYANRKFAGAYTARVHSFFSLFLGQY